MTLIERVHGQRVHGRRVRVLANHLARLIPTGVRVLDVGCGDGLLASLIARQRPDVHIEGIDVLVRPNTFIPVASFDGQRIPCEDGAFDVVMLVDVLHHTHDPTILLGEATRASRGAVVIKDHLLEGLLAGPTLRFMDWVGNARHDVALPYNYWSREQWRQAWQALGLAVGPWTTDVNLYGMPANWVFGRTLHFVTRLEVPARTVRDSERTRSGTCL